MYLSDIVDKTVVMREAFKHPALRIKPRSKKQIELDEALKVVVNTVEYLSIKAYADRVRETMQDILDTQVIIDGEYESSTSPSEWTSAIDDKVEEAMEPYSVQLSADWMARNTIGSTLHLDNGVDKFCMSFGREMFKSLTHDNKTGKQKMPAQILSNAGITKAEVEQHLAAHLNISKEEKENMAVEQDSAVTELIAKIAEHVGKDYDIMTVYNDLDLASDDDDILAAGAAPRLGLDEADIVTLQMVRLEKEGDTPDFLDQLLKDHFANGGKAKAKPATKPKAEKPAPAKKVSAEEASEDQEGAINASVFIALKESGGAKDTEFALGMGVSRATYNNWVNGKAECDATPEQYDFLRGQIVARLNALHEALATLDNTEAHFVV